MSNWLVWAILLLAGLFEVVWAFFLKESMGLTKPGASLAFVVSLAISMTLLGLALKTIPISVAYPIWTGIGAIGSVVVGVFWFGEAINFYKLLFLIMIVSGIIGLKTFS